MRAKIKADKTRKETIKKYEKDRAKSGANSMGAPGESMINTTGAGEGLNDTDADGNPSAEAEKLNELWQRVRYFLNGKDSEGNDVDYQGGGRRKFTQLCELKSSMQRGTAEGILPFDQVVKAFVSSRITPVPTDAEFKQIFRAIDAYHNEATNQVNWRAIL